MNMLHDWLDYCAWYSAWHKHEIYQYTAAFIFIIPLKMSINQYASSLYMKVLHWSYTLSTNPFMKPDLKFSEKILQFIDSDFCKLKILTNICNENGPINYKCVLALEILVIHNLRLVYMCTAPSYGLDWDMKCILY